MRMPLEYEQGEEVRIISNKDDKILGCKAVITKHLLFQGKERNYAHTIFAPLPYVEVQVVSGDKASAFFMIDKNHIEPW